MENSNWISLNEVLTHLSAFDESFEVPKNLAEDQVVSELMLMYLSDMGIEGKNINGELMFDKNSLALKQQIEKFKKEHKDKQALNKTPKIYLRNLATPVIIIHHDSGVQYGNQVNGHACNQYYIEGSVAPLDISTEDFENEINIDFNGWDHHYTKEEIERINKFLEEKFQGVIQVDQERINESVEAWVYLKITK